MTVATTATGISYSGNGTTVAFSFPYEYRSQNDLQVVVVSSANVATVKTLTSHYTVSGTSDSHGGFSGGTVTMVTAPASGETLVIRRKPSPVQESNPESEGEPLYAVHNALDYLTYLLQRQENDGLKLPVGVTPSFSSTLPDLPDDDGVTYYLGPNSARTALSWQTGLSAGVTVSSALQPVVTASSLRAGAAELLEGARLFFPEANGAVGDGTTDDTSAVQTTLNALGEGDVMVLRAGATYSVTNLTLPTNSAASSSGKRNGIVCLGGMATIKCRSGGDADYMVATDRWLTGNANKTFSGTPWHVENIVFDGNSLVTRTVVSKNFWCRWINCFFMGATGANSANFELTRQNQDASNGTSSYLGDNQWVMCRFLGSTAIYHFRSRGTNASDADANTDGTIAQCEFANAVSYDIYLGNGAGWSIVDNRLYSATVAGMKVARVSRGWLLSQNNMDSDGTAPGLILGEIGSYPEVVVGPGNKWYADIQVDFTADTSDERVIIQADHFDTQQAGSPDANVIHNYNNANKVVTIKDCSFEADPVYERGSGVTAGIIEVINCTSASASGNARNIAYLKDDPSASAGPVIRKVRRSASPAASDVLARDEYIGDDSGGNLTTYAATEVAIVDTTNASEDGRWRVKVMAAGSEVIGWQADATGAGYGAGVGGTVTQTTNRSTGVEINKVSGAITTDTTSLAAEAAATFTVTNSTVAATDVVVVSIKSGSNGGNTAVAVSAVAAGSFDIKVSNNNASGGTAETGAIVINFAVIKAVAS